MNSIKNIAGRAAAVWALLAFAGTLLVILIPVSLVGLAKEPARSHLSQRIFNVWMSAFFVLSGVRRIVKGKEHFRPGENYVIVCNHNSFMDVPLTSGSIPGTIKTIAKIEMARIPLFGIIYKRGSVLVNRKSERSRKESYLKMREVLKRGFHMCIYPEGTRNKGREPLQPFHDGAFRLSIDARKPVMPAVLFYTNTVLPRHKRFFFWPRPVEMHFLPPVMPDGKTAAELKAEVHAQMKTYYLEHR
jgi:1-acyl-sn-glycerol-3-phosphate acyltransferase